MFPLQPMSASLFKTDRNVNKAIKENSIKSNNKKENNIKASKKNDINLFMYKAKEKKKFAHS